jgi:hypothetical protein
LRAGRAAPTAFFLREQLLSVTAQQPDPSVQSAVAKPSVFSTCLGTVRPKKAAATTARITSAMIFFIDPLLDHSTILTAAEIHLLAHMLALSSQRGAQRRRYREAPAPNSLVADTSCSRINIFRAKRTAQFPWSLPEGMHSSSPQAAARAPDRC